VVTFKFFSGQVFTGKVVSVLEATSTGQPSGTDVTPRQVTAAFFAVRVKLDDAKLASSLPAGHRRRCGNFHRTRKAKSYYPNGDPAADCHPQLREPVLRACRTLGRRTCDH
jgi:hypothetical protein